MKKRLKQLKQLELTNSLFLTLNPAITALGLTYYFLYHSVNYWMIAFAIIFAFVTNLSITAGYHRHFAHKSYDTNGLMRFLFLFFGSSGFQGSALKWSSDHRRHHRFEDTENDPYSITRGFFHAHIGWLVKKHYVTQKISAPDLEKDFLIRHQHRHYLAWSIISGYFFPTLVGVCMKDPLGGLLIGGGLRIFLTQQSTFFVNSICHYIGNKPYCNKITARDSWFVALLTHGEGYHNFHHKFQIDYRNGIRWYQWDPTKWTIQALSLIGFAKKLRKVSSTEILKAKLSTQAEVLRMKGLSESYLSDLKDKIVQAELKIQSIQSSIQQAKLDLAKRKDGIIAQGQNYKRLYHENLARLKEELEHTRCEFKNALNQWNYALA